MKREKPRPVLPCVIALMAAVALPAADPKAPDPDLPGALDPAVAKVLLESPPFTRALNLSESLQLTGVAYVDGKPVATVKDRKTNLSYLVTDEPNSQGWRLAEATPSLTLKEVSVKIMVGSEVVPIRYRETVPQPTVARGGAGPSRIPTPQEFTGHDEKGDYVRGVPYLSDEDRERFRNVPREVREKFLNVVHDQRAMLFKASHEERAAVVKKAFDATVGR